MIRKYAKLRGHGIEGINEKTLTIVYERSSGVKQMYLKKEMNDYFDAIESGAVLPGQPIFQQLVARPSVSVQDERSAGTDSKDNVRVDQD
jgi:hypothetical protein